MIRITPELSRMIRHARNESMTEYAEFLGCGLSTYEFYENGRRSSRIVPELIGQKFDTGQLLQAQRTIDTFKRQTSRII